MNILFVTPRLPYPLDSGAKIRTFNLLKHINLNGHKVTLLSFIFGDNEKEYIDTLEKQGIKVITIRNREQIGLSTIIRGFIKGKPLTIEKYYSNKMRRELIKFIRNNNIDIVHFDHLHLGQYVDYCNGKSSVIDEHNIQSDILKRLYEAEQSRLKRILLKHQYKSLAKMERDKCLKASLVSVVSEEDKKKLNALCQSTINSEVIPNCVDADYFKPQTDTPRNEEVALVFTGAMDWLPNDDAIEYFLKDIIPLLWQTKPDLKFYVIGKNPSSKLRKLSKSDNRICVTGSVEDVRSFIAKAKVYVVPLRIGGGTRLKILEALAMEKAVVSTSIGAEGLNLENRKHILIADTPSEFVQRINELIDNDSLRKTLGIAGRKFVLEKYTWKAAADKLIASYMKLAKG